MSAHGFAVAFTCAGLGVALAGFWAAWLGFARDPSSSYLDST
jgi:hypothetical protein